MTGQPNYDYAVTVLEGAIESIIDYHLPRAKQQACTDKVEYLTSTVDNIKSAIHTLEKCDPHKTAKFTGHQPI